MPRTALETPEGKLLVVDMGGWAPNKGKLWLIDFRKPAQEAVALLTDVNLPHKILRGRDGKYYLGEANRILRFDLEKNALVHQETVVDGLPYYPEYLHPLKNFVFDKDNNLIVNIGSSSDRCTKTVSLSDCANGTEAGLRLYAFRPASNSWDGNFQIIATGLRNSMALAVSASGTILQAENSLDLASADEPYEEINIIENSGFYGWPLCYDRTSSLDESQASCPAKNYHQPWTLLPPHVAPMDALYYHHTKLPMLNNKLLLTWHGYKVVGHRLVAFDVDEQGRPLRGDKANFLRDPLKTGEGFSSHEFAAKNGTGQVAQHREIISRWNELDGQRPKGAPVGMSMMNDGSLLIVDDKNAAILRLSTGASYKDSASATPKALAVNLPSKVRDIFANRCGRCHEPMQANPEQLLNSAQWLQKNSGKTRLEQKLFDDKTMPMPPDNSLLPAEREQLRQWLQQI